MENKTSLHLNIIRVLKYLVFVLGFCFAFFVFNTVEALAVYSYGISKNRNMAQTGTSDIYSGVSVTFSGSYSSVKVYFDGHLIFGIKSEITTAKVCPDKYHSTAVIDKNTNTMTNKCAKTITHWFSADEVVYADWQYQATKTYTAYFNNIDGADSLQKELTKQTTSKKNSENAAINTANGFHFTSEFWVTFLDTNRSGTNYWVNDGNMSVVIYYSSFKYKKCGTTDYLDSADHAISLYIDDTLVSTADDVQASDWCAPIITDDGDNGNTSTELPYNNAATMKYYGVLYEPYLKVSSNNFKFKYSNTNVKCSMTATSGNPQQMSNGYYSVKFEVQIYECTGDGKVYLYVKEGTIKDKPGNAMGEQMLITYQIDNTKPTYTFTVNNSDELYVGKQKSISFTISYSDNANPIGQSNLPTLIANENVLIEGNTEGCKLQIDISKATVSDCSFEDGRIRLKVRNYTAWDKANNYNDDNYSDYVTVDNTAPTYTVEYDKTAIKVDTKVKFDITLTDNNTFLNKNLSKDNVNLGGNDIDDCEITDFTSKVNGKKIEASGYIVECSKLESSGEVWVEVSYKDIVNNEAGISTTTTAKKVIIDNLLPVVTINVDSDNASNATISDYNFIFNESGKIVLKYGITSASGVQDKDIQLSSSYKDWFELKVNDDTLEISCQKLSDGKCTTDVIKDIYVSKLFTIKVNNILDVFTYSYSNDNEDTLRFDSEGATISVETGKGTADPIAATNLPTGLEDVFYCIRYESECENGVKKQANKVISTSVEVVEVEVEEDTLVIEVMEDEEIVSVEYSVNESEYNILDKEVIELDSNIEIYYITIKVNYVDEELKKLFILSKKTNKWVVNNT